MLKPKILLLLCTLFLSSEVKPEELPPQFEGTFHLPNNVDAYNLEIKENGTFRWNVDGCDYGTGGAGVWKKNGNLLILEPYKNEKLEWSGKVGLFPVKQVEISSPSNGVFFAKITPLKESQSASVDNPQVWKIGRVCAQCGGLLGPIGPAKLCSSNMSSFSLNE